MAYQRLGGNADCKVIQTPKAVFILSLRVSSEYLLVRSYREVIVVTYTATRKTNVGCHGYDHSKFNIKADLPPAGISH